MKTIKELTIKSRRIPLAEGDEVLGRQISEPKDIASLARAILGGSDEESFIAIPVDIKNKPLGITLISKGGTSICPVDVKSVFRVAVMLGADSIFVAHNHPSSDTAPSADDIDVTRKILNAGKTLGIVLLDHVIVTDDSFYSLREKDCYIWEY